MNGPSEMALRHRRQLLKHSAIGFGGLALAALLERTGLSDGTAAETDSSKLARIPARAKRIVFLFMKGGPSHVDTFDPKPILDRDHGKEPPFALPDVTFAKQGNLLKSPWKFHKYGQSGLPVSELFPQVAKHIDDLCILRSVHGTNPAHGGALLKLHTGSDQFVRPSLGSCRRSWRAECEQGLHLRHARSPAHGRSGEMPGHAAAGHEPFHRPQAAARQDRGPPPRRRSRAPRRTRTAPPPETPTQSRCPQTQRCSQAAARVEESPPAQHE